MRYEFGSFTILKNGDVDGHIINRKGAHKALIFRGEGAREKAQKWAFENCETVHFALSYAITREALRARM